MYILMLGTRGLPMTVSVFKADLEKKKNLVQDFKQKSQEKDRKKSIEVRNIFRTARI